MVRIRALSPKETNTLEDKITHGEPLSAVELAKVREMLQLQRDFEAYGRLGRLFLFFSAIGSAIWVAWEWFRGQ